MRKITGPLIMPSIAAGWFLIFIPSFYELSMTALLFSSSTKTIGYQLFEFWSYTSLPMSCALAFGILLIVILGLTAVCVTTILKTRINYDLTKYLSEDTMTKKALSVMEKHKPRPVTVLPVIDADNTPVGIVHLTDLLRQGVV
jgi:galactitol-specific phosphotransferase system IIC component